MKKFYLFIVLSIFGFSAITVAETTNCSAQFTFSVNNNTVYFVPVSNTDSVLHLWYFGDGTSSSAANPMHTFTTCGTYTIYHQIEQFNPNGVMICQDSVFQVVTIICNTPCSATAAFSANVVNNQPNVYEFVNTSSVSSNSAVLCYWYFGDGMSTTTQNLSNQVHTYSVSGIYNVCLIVSSGTPGTTNTCRDTFCMSVQAQVNPTPCNLTANFTTANTSSPNVISFVNASTGFAPGDSIRWSFGDGTFSYNLHTVHTFSASGTYTVCLRIARYIPGAPPCISETCHQFTITNANPCNLSPSFSIQTNPNQPNTVVFVNTSTPSSPATNYATWSLGDSTIISGATVTHVYAHPGTYSVCMHITLNNTCSADTCTTITIPSTIQPCSLVAGFTYTATSAINTFAFVNTSNGFATGDSIRWHFGDGTVSYDINPTHTYAAAGNYQVCLWVKKNPTSPGTTPCVAEICHSLVITNPCNLSPSFSIQTNPNHNNTYVFTNTTITANSPSVTWSFGDSTVAGGNVVTHTFGAPGTYTVCMHVTVSNTCSSDTCITITVVDNPQPCNIAANFNWQNTPQNSTTASNVVYFYNTSIGYTAGDIITWNFGDGSTSDLPNPMHTFSGSGPYNVCLRVEHISNTLGTPPCVSEVCHTVIIPPTLVAYPNPASSIVNVNVPLNNATAVYAFLYNAQNVLIAQTIVAGVSGNNTITFNTANLAPGYYTIRIYYNGQFSVARFLKM
jgi:PKD repeat protein